MCKRLVRASTYDSLLVVPSLWANVLRYLRDEFPAGYKAPSQRKVSQRVPPRVNVEETLDDLQRCRSREMNQAGPL